jgi:hypothetical protein
VYNGQQIASEARWITIHESNARFTLADKIHQQLQHSETGQGQFPQKRESNHTKLTHIYISKEEFEI